MRQIILVLIMIITVTNGFALSHKGTKYVKVGDTFTLSASPKQYAQSTAWLWGGNVVPDTDIYGTTSTRKLLQLHHALSSAQLIILLMELRVLHLIKRLKHGTYLLTLRIVEEEARVKRS